MVTKVLVGELAERHELRRFGARHTKLDILDSIENATMSSFSLSLVGRLERLAFTLAALVEVIGVPWSASRLVVRRDEALQHFGPVLDENQLRACRV